MINAMSECIICIIGWPDKLNSYLSMKRLLLIIFTACITIMSANAQTKSYRGFVEGGYGAFVGSKMGSVLSFSTSHGKMFGPIFVGGGIAIEQAWVKNESYVEGYISDSGWDGWIGVKTFKGINVPVFANVKGIWDNKKTSPTFDLKAGLNLGMAFGLMGEVGTGCRFDLGKTVLATTVFVKGVHEPENLVTDDPKYVEGWFTSLGINVTWEF